MISITLNDEIIQLDRQHSIQSLINRMNYQNQVFAIALNQVFLPKSMYEQTTVSEADEIAIIKPMQGG